MPSDTLLLYKFIADLSVIKFLLSGEIKFTPISELNDPSELIPSVDNDAVSKSLKQLREHGYSDEDMMHLRQQENLLRALAPQYIFTSTPKSKFEASQIIQSSLYDSSHRLETLLNKTAREISSKVGLFCLSKRIDSLPMWAHYAANASGLAVEFQGLEQHFQGDNTGVLRQVTPVTYQRETYGMTFDPRSHKSLFFSKFQDWSYEQEARVVLPLSECRTHTAEAKLLFLYDIPKSCVSRLILGWHIGSEQTLMVKQHVQNINANVEVVHARFSRGKVALNATAA